MEALLDKRLVQVSQRRAPVDEVMQMETSTAAATWVGTPNTLCMRGIGKETAVAATHGLKAGYKKLDWLIEP